MTRHAEDALAGACVAKIVDFAFTIAALEAGSAKSLIAGENGKILDLVTTRRARVCAVVADEGAIAKKEKVCVGIEEDAASVAAEAIDVPSVTSCSQ